MPEYYDPFLALLDHLSQTRAEEEGKGGDLVIATHYYNPDDERAITGVKEEDQKALYAKQRQMIDQTMGEERKLGDIDLAELKTEPSKQPDQLVERVYGERIAVGLIALSWKLKEQAVRAVFKQMP